VKTVSQLGISQKILASTPLAMVIAISPWQTMDSINLPKFLILVIAAGALFALSVFDRKHPILKSVPRPALIVFVGILTSLVLSLMTSGSPFVQQLYGVNGRNTGFIAYASLLVIWLVAIAHSQDSLTEKVVKNTILGGQITAAYCLLQYFGADPISWNNPYSPILGFLGNPNFASAFLGISSVAAVTVVIDSQAKSIQRVLCASQIIGSLALIVLSNSQQGLLVIASGVAVLVAMRIYYMKNKLVLISFVTIIIAATISAVLGMLKMGPLSSILYQDSITFRGDYWRAAIQMANERPWFGVGLDSYGDWYRRGRDLEATVRRGPEIVTNAAHNVYLDMLANGGITLFVLYCASVILVIISIVKILKSGKPLNSFNSAIISCWVAFQIQSVISINQLGLVIWGWVFGGLIIGLAFRLRSNKTPYIFEADLSNPAQVVKAFTGVLVGLIIAIPPFYASAKFKSALETRNANAIYVAAKLFPLDPVKLVSASTIFIENKMSKQAVDLINLSRTNFPADFQTLKLVSTSSYFDEEERERAIRLMRLLDPMNESLKSESVNP
jgi:O-antigen ligase